MLSVFFLAPFVLDGAAECLTMLQMDLLDQVSLRTAFDGVIHTALLMHDNPASAAAGDARMRLGAGSQVQYRFGAAADVGAMDPWRSRWK